MCELRATHMNETTNTKHKRYDEAFKKSAVEHWLISGKSARQVAAELGINVQNLPKWKQKFKELPAGQVVGTLEALQAEKEIFAGNCRGPLHGVPIAVKDLFFSRDSEMTAGSPIYRDFRPTFDSTAVARLKAAGAVTVGRTNLHERAYGVTNENAHFGPCLNPWDMERVPGGSRGGSAVAVAAGLAFAALGTDTGGSIRIPASYCGVTGLKPTYGRVSRYGVHPLSTNFDHVGSFGRTVYDAAILTELIGGTDVHDPSCLHSPCPSWTASLSGSIEGWTIGVVQGSFLGRLHPDVVRSMDRAIQELEAAGVSLEEVEIPNATEAGEVAHLIQMVDGASFYHQLLVKRPESFSEDVRLLIEQGHLVSGIDYVNAQRFRRFFQTALERLFRKFHALVLPATPMPAPRLGQRTVEFDGIPEDAGGAATRLVRPFNLAGVPVLTLPCGFSDQLPLGLQIVTRAGDEFSGLRIGHVYQQRTQWHTIRPGAVHSLM